MNFGEKIFTFQYKREDYTAGLYCKHYIRGTKHYRVGLYCKRYIRSTKQATETASWLS